MRKVDFSECVYQGNQSYVTKEKAKEWLTYSKHNRPIVTGIEDFWAYNQFRQLVDEDDLGDNFVNVYDRLKMEVYTKLIDLEAELLSQYANNGKVDQELLVEYLTRVEYYYQEYLIPEEQKELCEFDECFKGILPYNDILKKL